MTNEGQGKTGFSRADLLWGMFATAADSEARKQLALSLGFELEHGVVEDTQKKVPPSQQQTALPADETRLEDEVKDTAVTEPQTTATTASYYRITGRKREEQEAGSEQEDIGQLPDWFAEASPTILVEAGSRIPTQHRVFPLHTELTRWSRLEPFLKKMLGARVAGMQVDTVRLVKQVAEGESIQRIPRKEHHGWAAGLCLLIDINSDNFPYRRDFIQLREKLLQVRGVEGLDVQYVLDEPGGYVTRYQHQDETVELWRTPARETPLLILSDLGMHAASQRPLYAWLVFGQLLKAQGIRPVVLMSVAERDMDKRLFNYFDCYEWDGTSDLKRVKGSYQSETDPRNHADSIEVLLGYFFATVRVDSGLLRAIRYLIPGEPDSKQPLRFHPFDIGHETAVWRHRATLQEGDEWGWKSGSKENYLRSAVKLLKILKPKKRQQLVELIGRYHATYPDELYFEAMYNLMLLEDQDAGLAGLVPAAIRSATDQYMADLAKTFAENPQDKLLENWVKRHLERHQADNIRKKHKYWLAFMAFARLHQEQREGKAEVPYPDFLMQADIAEISRYINHAKVFRRYQLKQQGEKLVLVRQDDVGNTKQAADDWGKSAVSGALLLNLSLNDERIFHIHTDSSGNQKNVSLNLDKIKGGFNFPANGKHEFQIGHERFTVDVSTVQQQKEPWMKFIASGSDGLYAESQTNAGDIYRWYWHPPEWSRDKGILPGAWYGSKQLGKVQRDTYGFYTDITIAGIPQRFRWIEPTAFMMGSPDGKSGEAEAGRYDNEAQHQVILTQGYWLAETASTQALWQAVTGDNPSSFKDANNPVENVSWQDVTDKFLKRVNKQYPQLKLRLPTEAEWENACRAGTTGAFNFEGELSVNKVNYRGTWDDYDTWGEETLRKTAAVKSYLPNQWGLYEMHGNVWEWCQDWYGGGYPTEPVVDPQGFDVGSSRMSRGGSWFSFGRLCCSAYRNFDAPGLRDHNVGFRLALCHQFNPVRALALVDKIFVNQRKGVLNRIKDVFIRQHTIFPAAFPESWASDWGEDEYGLWMGFTYKGVRQGFRWIEPGTFTMGSPDSEPERENDETQHEVTLTEGFWLAETTVSQALWKVVMSEYPSDFKGAAPWRVVMGGDLSNFKGEYLPVEQVSWEDAQRFIAKMNEMKPELQMCLPTEAQWEYCCRAGTTTPFYFGEQINSELVNFNGNSPYNKGRKSEYRQQTVEVESLPPNDWGLYEMHGNVLEWCQDRYGEYPVQAIADPQGSEVGTLRVLRGGSWIYSGRLCRSADRDYSVPGYRYRSIGFRLALGHRAVQSGQ